MTIIMAIAFLAAFVLLAIWVASPISTLPGPQVSLPKFDSAFATSAPFISDPKRPRIKGNIVLTITRNAEFFLDERAVLAENLQAELWKLKNQTDNPVMYLKADNALPYMWVVWASMRLKALGIDKVFLVVQVREQPHERVLRVQFQNWNPPIMF